MIELAKEQKVVLEFYKFMGAKWLAVDIDGEECFYTDKPTRQGDFWEVKSGKYWSNLRQQENNFDTLNLTNWEDEPINIDCLLKSHVIEYWEELPLDTKVEILLPSNSAWVKRHYAGTRNGHPCYYSDGTTSWSNLDNRVEVDISRIRVCE